MIDLAQNVIRQALAAGATDAECTISEGEEFSAQVRLGELETLKEAGSRGAGLRVLIGKYTGASYTSDLSPEGVSQMVAAALELAKITNEDPFAGLPEADELGSLGADLNLYSPDIEPLDPAFRIELAKTA